MSLPPSILTTPLPSLEPHLLVYEPSGLTSTSIGTLEPLVGDIQPIHLPARLWISCPEATCGAATYAAANTTNRLASARSILGIFIDMSPSSEEPGCPAPAAKWHITSGARGAHSTRELGRHHQDAIYQLQRQHGEPPNGRAIGDLGAI